MLMKVWKNVKSDIDPFNMLFFKAGYKSDMTSVSVFGASQS